MDTFAIYVDWQAQDSVGDDVVAAISRAFRPDDESVCIWIDDNDPAVLKLSVDVEADGYEEAGLLGRRLAYEAVASAHLSGELITLTACTEEGQAVWTKPDRRLLPEE